MDMTQEKKKLFDKNHSQDMNIISMAGIYYLSLISKRESKELGMVSLCACAKCAE